MGSETSGRVIHFLKKRPGWTEVDAYHTLFWIYAVMGVVNVLLVFLLTDACELKASNEGEGIYAHVPQDEDRDAEGEAEQSRPNGSTDADVEAASPPSTPRTSELPPPYPSPTPQRWPSRAASFFSAAFSQISAPTRHVMYKLWFLLAIDSLADGMVPYSLTNYYMDVTFHPSKSTLGDVTSISYFLGGIGAVFAGPLARKIGLINTMVFTHVPSSTAVLLFPLAPYFWITALFLFVRAGLNNMDQAPRSAFIAAVVRPEERTAVMGITSMLRNLGAMTGPTVTGILAEGDRFGSAFIAAGVCRLVYDFGLWMLFVDYERGKKLEDRGKDDDDDDDEDGEGNFVDGRAGDIEVELDSLADSDSSEDSKGRMHADANGGTKAESIAMGLHVPDAGLGRVRSRSPHRSTATD